MLAELIDYCRSGEAQSMARRKEKGADQAPEEFGARLAFLRKARGFTQASLGEALGASQRVIAYYEGETDRPPAHLLNEICEALGVTMDELMGTKPLRKIQAPQNGHLWRKLKRVEKLPPADRRTLLKVLDGLLAKNERT